MDNNGAMTGKNTSQKRKSARPTMVACFFSISVQAVIANLIPVLFIPMRELYGLSFYHLGLIVAVNFISQVLADIIFSGLIDKIGYRPLAILSSGIAIVGLVLLFLVPTLFGNAIFVGLLIATFVFAFASGLLEVIVSPIVDSFEDEKNTNGGAMAFMHSFYAFGQVICIVLTTLFIFAFGGNNWQYIVAFWALLPIVPLIMFMFVRLKPTVIVGLKKKVKSIAFSKYFIVCLLAIMFGAGSELIMNQWASGFVEKGLGVPKVLGDLLGMSMFALALGIGRLTYGLNGKRLNMGKILIGCSGLALGCYVITALSPYSWLSVAACALTGLGASLLWPGTLVQAAHRFPKSGAWMFAVLAAAGDIGGAIFPAIMGGVVDSVATNTALSAVAAAMGLSMEQLGLRAGILFGSLCPLCALICHIIIYKSNKKVDKDCQKMYNNKEENSGTYKEDTVKDKEECESGKEERN